MDKEKRIKELVEILNKAGYAYYQQGEEIMSNKEYDALYDELVKLEEETGLVLSNSPTINVGYEVLSELPKQTHDSPMLSLDKTKDREALASFLGNHKGVLSWKLDGLTIVLTYRDGKLFSAVTRGNGVVGEVVTNNAKVFKNIPVNIKHKGELVLRGEAIIKYSDFEMINESIEDVESKYKNPRNLCAGSVRQLSNEITAKRNVNFYAFALISAEGVNFNNEIMNQFEWLKDQGFDVVEHYLVGSEDVVERVGFFEEKIKTYDLPSDGLVLVFNDIEYGISLGSTAKFPRNGIAFKWADEIATTHLLEMEWSPSRTGLINPVAIFEPVELEGTTVSRASVHNLSIVESLELGIGDEITVYKANMIIPQIDENITRSGNLEIPKTCPACGGEVVIKNENGVKTLHCINKECSAKHIKSFTLFVSRDAFNIDGLSEETLVKFIGHGFIKEYADIFKLDRFEEDIVNMPGFGRKSYDNLIKAINDSRKVKTANFINALGIANVGLTVAKLIAMYYNNKCNDILNAKYEDLVSIEGIGDVIAKEIENYLSDEDNKNRINNLLDEIEFEEVTNDESSDKLAGKVFVITGSVNHFKNRDEVKEVIEKLGGKVTGSVTGKTSYLINNDINSNSGKNKKAKELGVPIISEEDFLSMIEE
ncbi:NAD-dependent DNA ligase LigA [uncultured Eubacterium sp.]|uniref:NAD-dependent DNA ligase LigA n=1 Tax=uncultured Eubacterium sp. TaxID=165185 RepID=UPI002592F09B|nr:NAD-dependent DNA ligase LigA [uncultured Eubacterium sp.]